MILARIRTCSSKAAIRYLPTTRAASPEKALGAANGSDSAYAVSAYSRITDLDHADSIYEWTFGRRAYDGSLVNQTLSKELRAELATYLASLNLTAPGGFGHLTTSNYANYLLKTILEPSATTYLRAISSSARASTTRRTLGSLVRRRRHVHLDRLPEPRRRSKDLSAFDGFSLEQPENIEFGDATTNARHFTLFSLRHATGNATSSGSAR
jgi:hypothetical protein